MTKDLTKRPGHACAEKVRCLFHYCDLATRIGSQKAAFLPAPLGPAITHEEFAEVKRSVTQDLNGRYRFFGTRSERGELISKN